MVSFVCLFRFAFCKYMFVVVVAASRETEIANCKEDRRERQDEEGKDEK